jgi:uncharacterized membrane protein (DUF2068 family)
MLDPEVLTDTITEWVSNLSFEYMILHIIVCYGLYHSDNLRWIVEYFSPVKRKGVSKAVWLSGGVLALIEMIRFVPFAIETNMDYTHIVDKFISIIHSYIVIQVFVEPIVTLVNKWLGVFKRTTSGLSNEKE